MWQEVIFSRRLVSSQVSVYDDNDFSHLVIKKKILSIGSHSGADMPGKPVPV